jgi:hypothetical protein
MNDWDTLLPYLPFFLVVLWGLYRMCFKLLRGLLARRD